MPDVQHKYPIIFRLMAIIAILFGLFTIKAGGAVLFTDSGAHQVADNYVPFALRLNFLVGFVYIAAGVGLRLQRVARA